ncbi:acyltransferase, partial [Pantoea endophytica]
DSVWLGENVTIQKGITIGKNSIIGSRALVTKTIPPGSLAVGIPAKIIRENVRWQRALFPMDFLPAEPY